MAEQQRESDRTLAELNKEKTNVELKERETLELQERNAVLQAELEKSMAELDLKKQSHEDVWKEEADKLDKRRVELVEERRRLEKLAIEIKNSKGAGGGKGEDEMLKFMQQQQDLLTKITSLEEKREIRETEESEKLKLKDSIGRGVKPPIFRGDKGERPEAHILRAEDWMEASNPGMTNAMKVRNFKLTLDHLAREWYDNADSKGDYEKLKGDFSRHFSTQGKSVRNLHARWNSFTFDPNTDDIEVFLRNVQETALLHAHVRDSQRRRSIFKLLEGDDRGTITLPTQGCMPIKVPNYNSFCITHFEAEKVYKCIESDQIVSPLVFHKDFQSPIESVRPEYQLLEEFLDNGNPIPNPYEEFLMNQIEVQEEKPKKVDPYFPNSKEINTHEMSEWSVLNTKMHYVQHPRQAENSQGLQ